MQTLGFCPRLQEGMLGVGVSARLAAEVAPVPSVQRLFLQLGLGEMLLEPWTGEGGRGCLGARHGAAQEQTSSPLHASGARPSPCRKIRPPPTSSAPSGSKQGRRWSRVSSHQQNSNTGLNFPLTPEWGDKDKNWHSRDHFFPFQVVRTDAAVWLWGESTARRHKQQEFN